MFNCLSQFGDFFKFDKMLSNIKSFQDLVVNLVSIYREQNWLLFGLKIFLKTVSCLEFLMSQTMRTYFFECSLYFLPTLSKNSTNPSTMLCVHAVCLCFVDTFVLWWCCFLFPVDFWYNVLPLLLPPQGCLLFPQRQFNLKYFKGTMLDNDINKVIRRW